MIRDVHPESGDLDLLPIPGSRIQGPKRQRIPDPDQQHCYIRVAYGTGIQILSNPEFFRFLGPAPMFFGR
jgi:hypothetical protein